MNKQKITKKRVTSGKVGLLVALFLLMALIIPMMPSNQVYAAPNLESASRWARADIELAVELGLVPQHLQSNYTQPTTRAEFAALAVYLYEGFTGYVIMGHRSFADTNDIMLVSMHRDPHRFQVYLGYYQY